MANLPNLSLRIIKGPGLGQNFQVDNQPKTIGRGSGCGIVVQEPTVSRLHVRLRPSGSGYIVENLVGKPTVFVNDKPVSKTALVRPGDLLRLGSTVVFKVQLRGASTPANKVVDDDATWMPRTQLGREPDSDNDRTAAAPPPAPVVDRTVAAPPPRQIQPTRPMSSAPPTAAPKKSSGQPLLWGMAVVILLLLVVAGGLAYLRFSAQSPATDSAAAIGTSETTATVTAATTATPAGPEATPTPLVLNVPGVPLSAAAVQPLPQDAVNLVDPFCNTQLAITDPAEPLVVGWQQRLASPDGEIDFVAQWLGSAHYELSLDGRPVPLFNVDDRDRPTLKMWANLGLLSPGTHYLRIEQFSDRETSTGLDVAPADGQVDVVPGGPVAEGYCEIVVPQVVVEAPDAPGATPATATPTATAAPTFTPKPTQPAAPAPVAAAPPGIFNDFESFGVWKRGDQPNGQFSRSTAQAHSGNASGQLQYNFPTPFNDYVVFLQSRRLGGRPNALSVWVYGDGAGHFLNAWLKDAGGQTWQMSFGRIDHTGWQELTAFIDPNQPWPSGHISGPDNGAIEYPLSFEGLTLDDGSDDFTGSGTVYIDDLTSKENAQQPPPTPAATVTRAVAPPPVVQPPVVVTQPPPANSPYLLQLGSQHRYEQPWGAPGNGDPCEAWRNDNWDDRNAGFRGFNVEVILTNNSPFKVADDWPDGMSFITSGGQTVQACYYGYVGAGPPPNGSTSITFFTVVPVGQYVQVMQLSLNGSFVQLCLDGRGGASYC